MQKSGFNGLTDNRPAVPVTVANARDYRPDPTVFASRATGNITITLSIPASSGRTIKEITRVSVNTTQTRYKVPPAFIMVTHRLQLQVPVLQLPITLHLPTMLPKRLVPYQPLIIASWLSVSIF
ncbi:hypothetical protein HK413_03285 [Mucilaginibacter sp. S1162]|uniref:Uncharacterized protein n=1 Tax=Mucilaginibacter humi TaxID=2732510 RepID=A0ABX1W1G4_9SPHI|nr:hypothetical protein [Mucilaginibacter humi]NNU33423.1 hypothetical protein [Mucilaginibacter humi]